MARNVLRVRRNATKNNKLDLEFKNAENIIFAHESEKEFAKILDFYRIKWEYESKTFTLEWDKNDIRQKRINDVWLPYKEEKEIIHSSFSLLDEVNNINRNITWNEYYNYDTFLKDFNNLQKLIKHYEDMPIMINNLNEFLKQWEMSKSFEKYTQFLNFLSFKYNLTFDDLLKILILNVNKYF